MGKVRRSYSWNIITSIYHVEFIQMQETRSRRRRRKEGNSHRGKCQRRTTYLLHFAILSLSYTHQRLCILNGVRGTSTYILHLSYTLTHTHFWCNLCVFVVYCEAILHILFQQMKVCFSKTEAARFSRRKKREAKRRNNNHVIEWHMRANIRNCFRHIRLRMCCGCWWRVRNAFVLISILL